MDRKYYLNLASSGLRFPVGTDLVLREKADHEAILRDGTKLGKVFEESARRWKTPLAIPLMDLTIEKEAMLEKIGVPLAEIPSYHFHEAPSDAMLAHFADPGREPTHIRSRINAAAVGYVAKQTDLLPVGMSIGPFSLMTKLLADPITGVYLAGSGVTASDDPEVATVERVMELGMRVILQSVTAQAKAGAKAMFVCEPAANKVYISPNQLEAGSDIFDRYVMSYNRRVKRRLDELGVDLIFHCCGELIDSMVQQFATLDPAILSLGSSRKLWKDACLVPKTTVMYGNLPSKRFYSDDLTTNESVRQQAEELVEKMRQVGHPFILGSECDVLSVPGAEATIKGKVMAMIRDS